MKRIICLLLCLSATVSADSALDSVQIYIQKGGKGLLDGDNYKALDNYSLALRLDPNNFEALRNIGIAYSNIGEAGLALENLQMAYKVDSTDAPLNNNLGALYSDRKEFNKAIRHFEKAVAVDSTNPMFFLNLGREYSRVGKIGQALPVLQKARLLAPDYPLTNFTIGNCFAASGAPDSAEYYYEVSRKGGGTDWELFYFLGSVKQRLGKVNEAIENYKIAIEKNAECIDCRQWLAIAYLDIFDYQNSIKEFKQVVEKKPDAMNAWIGLGAAYSLGDSLDQSKEIMNQLFAADSALGFQMLDIITKEHKRRKEAGIVSGN